MTNDEQINTSKKHIMLGSGDPRIWGPDRDPHCFFCLCRLLTKEENYSILCAENLFFFFF